MTAVAEVGGTTRTVYGSRCPTKVRQEMQRCTYDSSSFGVAAGTRVNDVMKSIKEHELDINAAESDVEAIEDYPLDAA